MFSRLVIVAAASLSMLTAVAQTDGTLGVQQLVSSGEAAAALQRIDGMGDRVNSDARLQFLRGVALMQLGRDDDAMAAFVAMTQKYPQLPEPFNNIAALHARVGQWEPARAALEAALRNDPANRLARENLGDVHMRLALEAWRAAEPATGAPVVPLMRKIRVITALIEASAR